MSEARAYAPKVTVVPATLNRFTAMPITTTRKRRVAAYARVSTDQEEQLTSYEAQVDYYTQYIRSKAEWAYVKVYTDVDTPYGRFPKRPVIADLLCSQGRFVPGLPFRLKREPTCSSIPV